MPSATVAGASVTQNVAHLMRPGKQPLKITCTNKSGKTSLTQKELWLQVAAHQQ